MEPLSRLRGGLISTLPPLTLSQALLKETLQEIIPLGTNVRLIKLDTVISMAEIFLEDLLLVVKG